MKMKAKFALVMMLFITVAFIPWIWISNQYGGLNSIPHYDLTMWIFMELYALICAVFFTGIAVLMFADGEEEPKEKPKPQKPRKRSGNGANKQQPKKKTQKKKPQKSRKPEAPGVDQPGEPGVEYPKEWDEREFE